MEYTGYMDGYLRKNLDAVKEVVKKDWDMVFIVDGFEGSGKSVLAQHCAFHCDPSLDIGRICFTPKEFVSAINKAQPGQAVVYDEAYGGMSSRAAMSLVNRSLMSVLAEIRQKNLFVFIVLPCFFELDKYAAVWRSIALIHVYTKEGFKRGFFSFYNQEKKKSLYILGKKFYSYRKIAPNFFGKFTKGYVVDEKEYKQKKIDALKAREEEPVGKRDQKHINEKHNCYYHLHEKGYPSREIASISGESYDGVCRVISKKYGKYSYSPKKRGLESRGSGDYDMNLRSMGKNGVKESI